MKYAKVESVIAITAICPDCGVACQNALGSQFIEKDERVICSSCGQNLRVPQSPFRVETKRSNTTKSV